MNIILIGYRGSGKTTIGKKLSELLGRKFIDCDEYIERKTLLSVREIFDLCGEAYFRYLEGVAVTELAKLNGSIISTGGGAVMKYKNVYNMKRNGIIIFLDVDPDVACHRIAHDPHSSVKRPRLTDRELLDEVSEQISFRRPYYQRAADYTINTSKMNEEQIVKQITSILDNEFWQLDRLDDVI